MTTRKRLINAAMRHFGETGAKTISIVDLARLANLARGTVYSHFPQFDALFDAVAGDIAQSLEAEIADIWSDVELPHERIALYMAFLLKRAHQDPHLGHFMVRFAPSTPSLYHAWSDLLPRLLRNCVAEGIMPPFEQGMIYYVQLLAGATYSFIMLVVDGDATWRVASSNLIQLCLHAGGVAETEAKRVAALTVERLSTATPART